MASSDMDDISSFTDAVKLKEWALVHDKLFDCNVRTRLLQLEESIKMQGVNVSSSFFILKSYYSFSVKSMLV